MFVYFIDVNLKPKPKFYKHVFQVLPKTFEPSTLHKVDHE